ncbi:response regulator transcription factor [Ruminiclostridium cellobioparum]|uniref:response regulator transcription factor n=1 Tax=Ruminiclostridium cellobioparum TaxID=29355 RepID=UPI000489DB87|nr:response regulator [Ruminiclostridium cellobioparum]
MYKALIVDDDRAIRYELKKSFLFGLHGFDIAGEAGDGKEALEKISSAEYDIVFVDIRMPRIDGIQFIRELRNGGNDLCVVIISGSCDYSFTRQAIKLGAFDYLLKPIEAEELDELLSNARLFLDEKGENRKLAEHTRLQLEESLKLPYSVQEEQELFRLIKESGKNAEAYAAGLASRLAAFYEEDGFKLSIVLENSLKNLYGLFLSDMPWLDKLQVKGFKASVKPLESTTAIIAVFISNIKGLAEFINDLHISGTNPVVKLLCEYFINNVEGRTTLEDAARTLNYSSKYLGKIFRQVTGESVVNYITRVKMERAKALVLSGKYKTYEISEIMGYRNTDYFTRLFKQYHNMTPIDLKRLTK